MKREVSDALNLPVIRKEKIIVRGFAQAEEVLRSLDIVRLKVWNISRENYREVELYVVPFICSPLCNQSIDLAKATYDHLISLPLADCTDGLHQLEIDLLIGVDYYWRFVSGRMVKGSNEPAVLETMLGWVLNDAMEEEKEENSVNVVTQHVLKVDVETPSADELFNQLSKFWTLESIGVADGGCEKENSENILKDFRNRIVFDVTNYHVQLPWTHTR